ncbi:DUF4097 family beta strand repeat-containing protein [Dyadobacter sandarakinus]|uniref:DUF4097 family beta strand repeat protein n=1 Tax=Dyadobacter sandarakinus TaxID=2747268 RepID=A0ABX7I5U6_9BACT|nr:DUF4097 family beta strand repeat-containing protein [Dyadobacter sandarakinus]QRR00381.1 DUF4097 family beta strand repeat protein [Dyadobacter sandarakinus]
MKTNWIKTLIVPAMLLFNGQASQAQNEVKEQLTVPLSDPSKPGSLTVNLIKGSIRIAGYQGNQVIVEVTGKSNSTEDKKEPAADGMRKIVPKSAAIDVTATEDKNKVHINSRLVNRPVDLLIKVPQSFSIKAGTIDDGNIAVDNVSGTHEISNVNGDITLTNMGGSIVANTINGTLKVTFRNADTKLPMAFSTLNGNVDVTLPPTAKFDVKLKSDNGDIFTDFDVQVDQSQPQASRSGKDGMYKVAVEDWVRGKVNGGGSEIMMKNMNGNIYVRKFR